MSKDKKRGKTAKVFLTEDLKEELLKYARAGLTHNQMAELIGICRKTLNNKLDEDHQFKREFYHAKTIADVNVEESLYRGATGYTIKQQEAKVVLDGKDLGSHVELVEVEKHIPGDYNKQRLWLMNRRPDRFKDKQQLEVSMEDVSDEKLLEMVVDAIKEEPELAELLKK